MQLHLSTMHLYSAQSCLKVFTLQVITTTLCKSNYFQKKLINLYRNLSLGVDPRTSYSFSFGNFDQTKNADGYGNDYSDKSRYRFLNSFNMFKGLKLSFNYEESEESTTKIDRSIYLGTKFNVDDILLPIVFLVLFF